MTQQGSSVVVRETGEIIESQPLMVSAQYVVQQKQSLARLQQLVREVLVKDRDYGHIAGLPGEMLFDPGASLIIGAFNCHVGARRIISLTQGGGKVAVILEVPIVTNMGQQIVGSGVGAASTYETKNKYRWEEDPRPFGYDEDAIDQLQTREKNGKTQYRILNPEPEELLNTIVAMACLGSTTPVLFRTDRSTVRSNVSKMFTIFKKGSAISLPTPKGWSRVTAMARKPGVTEVLNIKLRDQSHIRVTPEHRFPTTNGLKSAVELQAGDVFLRSRISLPDSGVATSDYGWLVGLFVAEGHYSDGGVALRFTLNKKEGSLAERIGHIVAPLGCRTFPHDRSGSETMDVNVYGSAAAGIMKQFINGDTCYDKHLSKWAWSQSPEFLRGVMNGYLDGDGCFTKRPGRRGLYQIGFTGRNYDWAEDLRTLCAISGLRISVKPSHADGFGVRYKIFDGWIKVPATHHNIKDMAAIVEIKTERRPAVVYDISIEDGDSIFLLATGIQTHNSKRAEVDAVKGLPGVNSALKDLFENRLRDNPSGGQAAAPERNRKPAAGATGRDWTPEWTAFRQMGLQPDDVHKYLGVKSLGDLGDKSTEEIKSLMIAALDKAGVKPTPPAKPGRDPKTITSLPLLWAAIKEDWNLIPADGVKILGYTKAQDILETPADAYIRIREAKQEPPES